MLGERKDQHLDIVLSGRGQGDGAGTGLEAVRFVHCALPEMDLDEVDLGTVFLGRPIAAPLLVSSMTGGPARAAAINRHLAEACEALRLPLAVGSQRVALEGAARAGWGRICGAWRRRCRCWPIWGGAAQHRLRRTRGAGRGRDDRGGCADPASQPAAGGRAARGRPELARDPRTDRGAGPPPFRADRGQGGGGGLSGAVARQLWNAGVQVLDVAGSGGTSWAAVEAERARTPAEAAVARAFAGWGIPTARAIAEVRAACPDAVVIGSGGIRDGLDAARAIRLGADLVGQAAGLLAAATEGPEAVAEHLSVMIRQLRVACFCTGSRDLAALRRAPLQD